LSIGFVARCPKWQVNYCYSYRNTRTSDFGIPFAKDHDPGL
jgi:hypothetical protein